MSTTPVAILDPRERPGREGWIEHVQPRPRRVDVLLTLDDGTAAEACLSPEAALWLEPRVGEIVGVEVLPVLPRCDAEPVTAAPLALSA